MSGSTLAQALFDDELRAHQIDIVTETDTVPPEPEKQDGAPFLLQPDPVNKSGVVLVHGFLASPAEVRALGERLATQGHPVIGVRLKGHGTSPQDLRLRSQHEWMESVRRGYDIMSNLSNEVLVVGFGTGASLALLLAAERPKQLAFVSSVSAPITFRMQSVRFAPWFHLINSFSKIVYGKNGLKPFTLAEPDHPDFEYRNMPVQALAELRKIAEQLEAKLADVNCPVMIIQASHDPVVKPESAQIIEARIGSMEKTLHIIESDRHGILHENIGGVQELIVERLGRFTLPVATIKQVQTMKLPHLGLNISGLLSRLSRREITVDYE
jgi:esterase/lipase